MIKSKGPLPVTIRGEQGTLKEVVMVATDAPLTDLGTDGATRFYVTEEGVKGFTLSILDDTDIADGAVLVGWDSVTTGDSNIASNLNGLDAELDAPAGNSYANCVAITSSFNIPTITTEGNNSIKAIGIRSSQAAPTPTTVLLRVTA